MWLKSIFACCFGHKIIFECEECPFHTNCKDLLKEHIRTIHEMEQKQLIKRAMRRRRAVGVIDI